jgi:hypothetical protein
MAQVVVGVPPQPAQGRAGVHVVHHPVAVVVDAVVAQLHGVGVDALVAIVAVLSVGVEGVVAVTVRVREHLRAKGDAPRGVLRCVAHHLNGAAVGAQAEGLEGDPKLGTRPRGEARLVEVEAEGAGGAGILREDEHEVLAVLTEVRQHHRLLVGAVQRGGGPAQGGGGEVQGRAEGFAAGVDGAHTVSHIDAARLAAQQREENEVSEGAHGRLGGGLPPIAPPTDGPPAARPRRGAWATGRSGRPGWPRRPRRRDRAPPGTGCG